MPALDRRVSVNVLTSPAPLLFIAHQLPGRVRLILQGSSKDEGLQLACRFSMHPDVTGVRWAEAARSLTVRHRPERQLDEILDDLQFYEKLPAPVTVVQSRGGTGFTLAAVLMDLLTGNFLSLALNLLSLKS